MRIFRSPTLFFYPTYICNDSCSFCFFFEKMIKNKIQLSFEQTKKAVDYLIKKFSIQSVVLAGGEPTIYRNFTCLMDYLGERYIFNNGLNEFHLATNAIKCADDKFVAYLSKFFIPHLGIFPQLNIAASDFEDGTAISRLKKQGAINLSKRVVNVNYILVLTKKNLAASPKIIDFIRSLFQSYYRNSPSFLGIELRIPFLVEEVPGTSSSIPPPRRIKRYVTSLFSSVIEDGIPLKLRNIPFCYIENLVERGGDYFVRSSKPAELRMVEFGPDSIAEIKKIKPRLFLPEVIKMRECRGCQQFLRCSGIDPVYLKKFSYPSLNSFVNEL